MKTLFVGSLFILVGYFIQLPITQYLALRSARNSVSTGSIEEGRDTLRPVLKQSPRFFREEGDTLFARIADRHFARATASCQQGNYVAGLVDFEQIATRDYGQSVLARTVQEEGMCRLAYAHFLVNAQRYNAAAEQILRVLASGDKVLREAAAQRIPILLQHEKEHLAKHYQYALAFKTLADRRLAFASVSEIYPFFSRIQNDLETGAFGMPLAHACQRKSVNSDIAHSPKGLLANVIIENDSKIHLRLILRDLTQAQTSALTVSSRQSKKVKLDSTDYLVAVHGAGDCSVKPLLASWLINPIGVFRAKFVELDDGSVKTIESSAGLSSSDFIPVPAEHDRS